MWTVEMKGREYKIEEERKREGGLICNKVGGATLKNQTPRIKSEDVFLL